MRGERHSREHIAFFSRPIIAAWSSEALTLSFIYEDCETKCRSKIANDNFRRSNTHLHGNIHRGCSRFPLQSFMLSCARPSVSSCPKQSRDATTNCVRINISVFIKE